MLFLVAVELAYLPSLCEFIEAHVEVVSGKVLLHLTRFFLSEHTPLRQVLVGYRLRYVGCRRIELRPYRPPCLILAQFVSEVPELAAYGVLRL